ncbi:hypothetical protein FOL47_007343 [Perkinsus chesapeaki]|uniref:Uncharacterized protein n=1 Tax=Perkinsus chesapeaki TaxID=330153 RepID=A0A7J6MVV6_PERCH|nr:hypothetical protein FOL47_007343 [Perkinsus chesapeaki]
MFLFRIPLLFTTAILSSALRTARDAQMEKLTARIDDMEKELRENQVSLQSLQKSILERMDQVEELVKSSAIQLPGAITSTPYGECKYQPNPFGRRFDDATITLRASLLGKFEIRTDVDLLTVGSSEVFVLNQGYGQVTLKGKEHVKKYHPLFGLPDTVKEEIKKLVPDNVDDCRRLFTLIAQHPANGYRPGIDWLWSFLHNTVKRLQKVMRD